jgi:hypothetical protein
VRDRARPQLGLQAGLPVRPALISGQRVAFRLSMPVCSCLFLLCLFVLEMF